MVASDSDLPSRSITRPPGAGSSRQNRPFLKLGVAFVAGLLALVASEAFCRLFLPVSGSIRFEQDVEELRGIGLSRLASVFENDSELFWRFAPNQTLAAGGPFFGVISNDAGLREDHHVPLETPENEFRVLFLGDSCTFGYGLDHAQSFVQNSEDRLRQRLERPVECLNAGVPGYSLFQGWQLYETRARGYQPEVVVLCFGWNDMVSWDARSDLEHLELARSAQPNSILRWSRLCQMAWQAAARLDEGNRPARPRLLPREFRALLDQFRQGVQAHDAQLLVLVWGFRFQVAERPFERTAWQNELYEFAQQSSVPLIDLVTEFQQLANDHGVEAVFLDEGHGTQLANARVGELLSEVLARFAGSSDVEQARSPGTKKPVTMTE